MRHPVEVAQAAVLARLWGALAREPIPGIIERRQNHNGTLTVRLTDGRRVCGPAVAAQAFAEPSHLTLAVNGVDRTDPAELVRELRLAGRSADLAREVSDSVANLALARTRQPEPDGGPAALVRAALAPDPLAFLEQSVVDGHPLHPCCRTRLGMDRQEVQRYGPEHRPVVDLHVVEVPADRWYGVNCAPLLHVHPWQYDHVLDSYPWLRRTGRTVPARPLMSLRTLSLVDQPGRHVKTAVDVQMTSAVRTVSPAAVHNGPALSTVLEQVLRRTPELSLLPEVSAGAALVNGQPCHSLAVVHRDGPRLGPDELALPLAVLAAPAPADHRPIVAEVVRDGYGGDALAFVEALARLVLPPLLVLLELGVGLEAHGQNLLVVLRAGRLRRLAYRDLGGLRVSPRRLRAHGFDVPLLWGDLENDDPQVLRTKVFAAAVSTAVAQVIARLAAVPELAVEPELAWSVVAKVARQVPGHGGLFGPTLPLKATTAMRLSANPLDDIWTAVPNPMEGLG